MKKPFLLLIVLSILTACTPTPAPISATRLILTQSATPPLKPTETTVKKELIPENVGLIIGREVDHFIYKRCYINTNTHFHAGDAIYYEIGNSDKEYIVYAPIDGQINFASRINDSVGWEIRVETDFFFEGEKVWYDLVHNDGLIQGMKIGDYVLKGEPIAVVHTARDAGRIEKLVDIAFRNGPRGPNPQVDPFYPESYIDVFPFVADDLKLRDGVTFEKCEGNPK